MISRRAEAVKKKPQRMCVSCKTRKDKKDLLRVVLMPDGNIAYDPTGKAAGRGSYLCRDVQCIMTELKAHRLSKGLRHRIDEDDLKSVADEILKLCEADAESGADGE
ncbi:MAG: YlxR family protein [Clostridiales bacterium]|nr:YlxR family protein [Clostridiales bacterium]